MESKEGRASGTWTFFTNHAHVIFVLASDPEARLRDVAERVQITERAAQRIVHELEEEGYLKIIKQGRRNHYVVQGGKRLRHPIEKHRRLSDLIEVLDLAPRARRAGAS